MIAGDYQEHPPRKIAVLPFVDEGKGSYLIDMVPLKTRDKEALNRWSWTHANRVRRALAGDLATREFFLVPLLTIDAVLAKYGISDKEKLNAVPPEELGRWLDVDTVVYGELLNYEAYNGFLVAAWRVSARVRMVSTLDGHDMKRLLLSLSLGILLSSCVTGGVIPDQSNWGSCPQGQYWSTTSQACQQILP